MSQLFMHFTTKLLRHIGATFSPVGIFLLMGLLNLLPLTAQAVQSEKAFTIAHRYDAAGRLTGTINPDPDGNGALKYLATRQTYNSRGLLTKVETGQLSSWLNETVAPKSWSGFTVSAVIEYTYDSYGRRATESRRGTDGTVESLIHYSYDSRNRLHCKAQRMNKQAFTSLPSSACTAGTQGTLGADRITRYSYNKLDLITKEERGVDTPLQQAYVTNEYYSNSPWLKSMTDANGNKTELRYDSFGRLARRVYPSPTASGALNESDYNEYRYDANNNLIWERKRNGTTISYTFDNLNRMVAKDLSNNTYSSDIFYDYDLRGLTLYSRYGSRSGQGVTNVFDGFGNLTSSTINLGGTARTLSYQYDANNNRTRITHPDGYFFTYSFDGLNRVNGLAESTSASASATTSALLSLTYGQHGKRQQIARTGGATTTYQRDNLARLSGITQDLSGTGSDLTSSFLYNPANQLIRLTHSNSQYHYRGSETRTGSYIPNGLNQYTRIDGQPLGYDTNGNLTNDGYQIYTYDMENRLVATSRADTTSSVKYDPLGRLHEVTINNTKTQFLYDGDALIAEYNGTTGALQRRYVHGDQVDEPWVQYNSASVGSSHRRYLHANHQGSIIAHSGATAGMLNILAYDSFGIPANGNVDRFGYTGQLWFKELGLFHYKARMYSPKVGRFLQTDPVFYADQMNLYAYVGNDPVNMVDPTGKKGLLRDIVEHKAKEKLKAKTAAEGAKKTDTLDKQRECQLEKCTPPKVSLSVCMVTNCSEALMGDNDQHIEAQSSSESNNQETEDRKARDERVQRLREEREERIRERELETKEEPEPKAEQQP